MDGPETLKTLRNQGNTADIPVVFITARTQAFEIDRFIELGAAGVLPKPFDPIALSGEVKKYLGGAPG